MLKIYIFVAEMSHSVCVALLDIFGKRDVSKDLTKRVPYVLSTEFTPYRLYSGRKSSLTMYVRLKNVTNEVLLTSLVVELPNKIGFDEMAMNRARETRIGEMTPQSEKGFSFNVCNSAGADKGEYTLTVTAIAHYRDYGHVMNAIMKHVPLQVA